jgi:hypothetical protein
MNNRILSSILTCTLIVSFVFATLPLSLGADSCIFGYPYYTTQAGGSGAKYDSHGSLFTLKGDADITSISSLMDGGYSPTEPNDNYIYRYAIYGDNNGKVGALIAQTETGTFKGTAGGSQDVWNTANFPQIIHLSAGAYWLVAVHNASQYISIHSEYPASNYTIFTCVIDGMDFPSALNAPVYSQNFVLSIYASGTGSSSIPEPVNNPNTQKVSRLLVGCIENPTSDSYMVLITGNLTANYAAIPSAPVLLSYADNPNATWHEIATVTTASDGSFTTAWSMPTGSYVINATYVGDSNYTAQTTLANVIQPQYGSVFSVNSNSTVSKLAFDYQTEQLSFSVNGTSGTTGYAAIYIPKSLVDDASKIHASIDGEPAAFTASSINDAGLLYFNYHHSTHEVVFSLGDQNMATVSPVPSTDGTVSPTLASSPTTANTTAQTATPIPELTLTVAAVVIAALLVGLLIMKRKRQ